jgi:hypothetical protein
MVRILVTKFGDIQSETVDSIFSIMEECYNRLEPHGLSLVDLYLFERSSALEAFLSKEHAKMGVTSSRFDEDFYARHDAWTGIPRISISVERIRPLPELTQAGILRHEVGHSILHGSPEYYIFPIPHLLSEASERFDLPIQYLNDLLYLISIAVKDFEVTHLLLSRGYIEDQVAYAESVLKVSQDDLISWEIGKIKPQAKILCVVSRLKDFSCASALMSNEKLREKIGMKLLEAMNYFPEEISKKILNIIFKLPSSLQADTLRNIDGMTRIIVEEVIEPAFRRDPVAS